jgi:hypothetical protein
MASFAKDIERIDSLCTVDENVKWSSHYGKQYDTSLKNEMCNCTISYATIERRSVRGICSLVLIAVLFTVTNT